MDRIVREFDRASPAVRWSFDLRFIWPGDLIGRKLHVSIFKENTVLLNHTCTSRWIDAMKYHLPNPNLLDQMTNK